MKKIWSTLLLFTVCAGYAQDWKPAGDRIMTAWASEVDPRMPHPEYPRPQMKRDEWMNLNGLWDYSIRYKDEEAPTKYAGKILVPFTIESALSGIGKKVGDNNTLWYHRRFELASSMRGKRILLHFGAVDWEAEVWVNGKKAGLHRGGYDPFQFDITELVSKGPSQDIVVRVWDPVDQGPQPRGKQVSNPSGIWYTSVTGIWQTVWIEAVPETHVEQVYTIPDLDAGQISVHTRISAFQPGDRLQLTISDGAKTINEITSEKPSINILAVKGLQPWSPDTPKLYDLTVRVNRNGKQIDEVKSYFAMRKISLEKDARGIQWVMLNNRFLFQYGTLDQGWWPDGLYTAPTAAALRSDIERTKQMGFNMIRKHVKVEPALWYRYCDSIGMLVWQDMPSGDMSNQDKWTTNPALEPTDKIRSAESENIYRTELQAMVDAYRCFPSIVMWVPFNESWGQFKTVEITEWLKTYDPSRLVNPASGGNFHATGDIHDLHNYPDPMMHRTEIFARDRAMVLGEFGGLGLPIEGHTWTSKSNWGYQSFRNKEELFSRYSQLIDKLITLIPEGLSAAIYTQTTDVETEVNGLMTYDRKLIKFAPEAIREVNQKLYKAKQ